MAVEPGDFVNRDAITTRVLQQVAWQASAAGRALSWGLGAVAAMVRAGEAGEELRKALAGRDAKNVMIVLHMDEAQRVPPTADGVVSLHTRGMEGDIPTSFQMEQGHAQKDNQSDESHVRLSFLERKDN